MGKIKSEEENDPITQGNKILADAMNSNKGENDDGQTVPQKGGENQ